MFSPSRGREGEEERGGGGKLRRRRRREAAAPPYARPENSLPAAAAETGNPKWFSGIISGAGRLISSVFRSESEESSSSSSSEDGDGLRDEDDDVNVRTEDLQELDEAQRSDKLPALCGAEESPREKQWSERKLAIKHLLREETFSREESDVLIKIIQSRVVDPSVDFKSGGRKNVPEKSVYNDLTFLGTWRSINKGRKFPDGVAYSSNLTGERPSEASTVHGFTQDLCDKAVMEAKQWLDKKKLESATKSNSDLGPCTLNTSVWDVQAGSPVDVARTYMQSRPPWQSPTFTGFRFRSPPTGTLLFKDETPSSVKSDILSSPSLGLFDVNAPRIADGGLSSNPLSSLGEGSKSLHRPNTPEFGFADSSTSPDKGAVNISISIPLSPKLGAKPADPPCESPLDNLSSNGTVNAQSNISSLNFVPDPDEFLNGEDFMIERRDRNASSQATEAATESPFSALPNYVLVNDQSLDLEAEKTMATDDLRSNGGKDRHTEQPAHLSPSQPPSLSSGPPPALADDGPRTVARENGRGSLVMAAEQTVPVVGRGTARAVRTKRVVAKNRRGRSSVK
ncbi:flocculation protein [Wolffia australiana]